MNTTVSPQSLTGLLVAHRGEPVRYPENTLHGFDAALKAGARYVETDIQLTADGVAVLCHDVNLLRVTGHDMVITRTPYRRLHALPANEPRRFGDRFADLRIGTLDAFVALLSDWPDVHAFVEIKPQSFSVFGSALIQQVLIQVEPIANRCTLITSSSSALDVIAASGYGPRGWVLPGWSENVRSEAERLNPAVLFVDHKMLPGYAQALWPGEWRWAVYTVNRMAHVTRLIERGIHLIETNNISALLEKS
jgi:glycerophosphoryl diester phosphodiesterase